MGIRIPTGEDKGFERGGQVEDLRMCSMNERRWYSADRGGGWMKPTVEECADAFVLMAKSSSMTGSSLKIGKSFSEECGWRGYELMGVGGRCWVVRIGQWAWDGNPISFAPLDISYYTRGKEAQPHFYLHLFKHPSDIR